MIHDILEKKRKENHNDIFRKEKKIILKGVMKVSGKYEKIIIICTH